MLQTDMASWREVFFDHLRVAIKLHNPHDVYIVEHRNCGAYREFLGKEYGHDNQEQEREDHKEQANALAKVIAEWYKKESAATGKKVELKVTSFLMDLRGDIALLSDPQSKRGGAKDSAKKRAGR